MPNPGYGTSGYGQGGYGNEPIETLPIGYYQQLRPGCESQPEAPVAASNGRAATNRSAVFRWIAPAWRWVVGRV